MENRGIYEEAKLEWLRHWSRGLYSGYFKRVCLLSRIFSSRIPSDIFSFRFFRLDASQNLSLTAAPEVHTGDAIFARMQTDLPLFSPIRSSYIPGYTRLLFSKLHARRISKYFFTFRAYIYTNPFPEKFTNLTKEYKEERTCE